MGNEKPHYDYIRTINAPYWIQEIKTPKGQVLWTFSMPMEVSFFVTYFVSFVSLLLFRGPILLATGWFLPLTLFVYLYVPFLLAKNYVEVEPDGKKMLVYLKDCLRFLLEFGLDKRLIYQGKRSEKLTKTIVYEKTTLSPVRKEFSDE